MAGFRFFLSKVYCCVIVYDIKKIKIGSIRLRLGNLNAKQRSIVKDIWQIRQNTFKSLFSALISGKICSGHSYSSPKNTRIQSFDIFITCFYPPPFIVFNWMIFTIFSLDILNFNQMLWSLWSWKGKKLFQYTIFLESSIQMRFQFRNFKVPLYG